MREGGRGEGEGRDGGEREGRSEGGGRGNRVGGVRPDREGGRTERVEGEGQSGYWGQRIYRSVGVGVAKVGAVDAEEVGEAVHQL